MNKKLIVFLITAISLAGCTTMRPIDGQERNLADEMKAGDHVIVYEKTGRILDMNFSHIEGDLIRGSLTQGGGTPVEVSVADIERVEVEKIDGARTTLAVVGGTVVLVPLLFLVGMSGGMFSM